MPDQQQPEQQPISEARMDKFENAGYRLLQPMTIHYQRLGSGYVASWPEANIAVSGTTREDAYDALEIEILDAFDDWSADEAALGPGPQRQFAVLKKYIQRC